jgi:hypothetical protein
MYEQKWGLSQGDVSRATLPLALCFFVFRWCIGYDAFEGGFLGIQGEQPGLHHQRSGQPAVWLRRGPLRPQPLLGTGKEDEMATCPGKARGHPCDGG